MKRATLALVAAFAAVTATADVVRTATENWTRNRIAEATNATLQAAKDYADAHGGVDTNAVEVIANKAVETNALTRALAARTGADITTGGNYTPFGYTDPANYISYNIMNLDYGIADTGDRIDELVDEAWEAFALKEESVANQDGEANDLTVNGLTANYDATFNDNVYIGPNSLYLDGRLIEEVFSGYTPRGVFNALENEFGAHRDNTNIHVTASEKAAWNAKLSPSDVIDPASATTTGKAADAKATGAALAAKADSSTTYTRTEVDGALAAKRDKLDLTVYELAWDMSTLPAAIQSASVVAIYGDKWYLHLSGFEAYSVETYDTEADALAATECTLSGPDVPTPTKIYKRRVSPTEDTLALTSDIPAPYTPSAADPVFSNAVVAVTTNEIRREVSAAMNTYVDGDTGVEYVGKFYGGNLYYVPTGNVYPPNN